MEAFLYLLWMLLYALIFAFAGVVTILWIYTIIDCARRDFSNQNEKTAWLLALVFAGWLGMVAYYFMRRGKSTVRDGVKDKPAGVVRVIKDDKGNEITIR